MQCLTTHEVTTIDNSYSNIMHIGWTTFTPKCVANIV